MMYTLLSGPMVYTPFSFSPAKNCIHHTHLFRAPEKKKRIFPFSPVGRRRPEPSSKPAPGGCRFSTRKSRSEVPVRQDFGEEIASGRVGWTGQKKEKRMHKKRWAWHLLLCDLRVTSSCIAVGAHGRCSWMGGWQTEKGGVPLLRCRLFLSPLSFCVSFLAPSSSSGSADHERRTSWRRVLIKPPAAFSGHFAATMTRDFLRKQGLWIGNTQTCTKMTGVVKLLVLKIPRTRHFENHRFLITLWVPKNHPNLYQNCWCAKKIV